MPTVLKMSTQKTMCATTYMDSKQLCCLVFNYLCVLLHLYVVCTMYMYNYHLHLFMCMLYPINCYMYNLSTAVLQTHNEICFYVFFVPDSNIKIHNIHNISCYMVASRQKQYHNYCMKEILYFSREDINKPYTQGRTCGSCPRNCNNGLCGKLRQPYRYTLGKSVRVAGNNGHSCW